MHAWSDLVLFNAAGATLLALVVALVGLRTKRPALLHALWLVVLLKLVSIPAAEVALVPRLAEMREAAAQILDREPRIEVAPGETSPARGLTTHPASNLTAGPAKSSTAGQAAEPARATDARPGAQAGSQLRPPHGRLLALVAALGGFSVAGLALVRTIRLQRSLRAAPDAPAEVAARVATLARRFGVAPAPRVRWVPGRMSPAVWLVGRRSEILFPASLWGRLTDPERDALLAHEIAHVRRGDPRVRVLELVVLALYWWHPVAWWARRNLRAAEEKACDALVVEKLPHSARAYVEGLLKTVEFLACAGTRAPSLATANDVSKRLKERVIMILTTKPPRPLAWRIRVALLAAAIAAVLTSPAWIDPPPAALEEPAKPEISFAREQLALEKERHELEMRRVQIQLQLESTHAQRRAEELREEIRRLRARGDNEDAARLESDLARAEIEMRMHREQVEMQQRHELERSKLDFQLRELTLQREELLASGREDAARELLERAHQLENEVRKLDFEAQRGEIEFLRRQLERETQELESMRSAK